MLIDPAFLMIEILIILQYLNPIADLFPSLVQIPVFVLWFLFFSNKKIIRRCLSLSIISLAIMAVTIIRCIVAGKIDLSYFSPMSAAIGRYQFFVYVTMFPYIIQLDNRRKEKLFRIAICSMTITVIVSLFYIFFVDPQAIRNTQGVSYYGVGDFQLMYAMALLGGPYFQFIRRRIKNKEKYMFDIVCFVLMCLCILLCNLVTSVVILSLSVALSFFIAGKKVTLKMFAVILFGIVIALKNVWAGLLRTLASKNIFYWSTNKKILAIANLISGTGDNLDTLSLRLELTNISIESFKRHPVFGINFRDHMSGVVGCHAQWADDLARFGLFGNIVIWADYIRVCKYSIINSTGFEMRSSMITAWVTFFILGFLNPCLSGTILMAMFVVIPSMTGNGDKRIESFNCESIS